MAKTESPVKTHLPPLPAPLFTTPYQNGIADPLWPPERPAGFDPKHRARVEAARVAAERLEPSEGGNVAPGEIDEKYRAEYAGRVARQDFMSALRADVRARSRSELVDVLRFLAGVVIRETEKKASAAHVRPFDPIPDSYRVTITVGFGASLFVDRTGFDRYGITARRPKYLKTMPRFPGDAVGLDPTAAAADLIIVVASDHPYVNVAIVRFFAEFFNPRFRERHPEVLHDVLTIRGVEEGFARKDKREYIRFDDGIENLHIDPAELRRLTYVDAADGEPAWCEHGSYFVYRKVREAMPAWEALDATPERQEAMIGRRKLSGAPLSRTAAGHDGMTPVYPDPTDSRDGPLNAHIRKVQPRRPTPDLFGFDDLDRRFLRRPYPFFDGLDANGRAVNGLQFLAFMKSIPQQFEHVVTMWQMNPDFPVKGTGIDALYANGILSTVDGGYYFCPPGLTGRDDFFGSGLFAGDGTP